MPRAAVRSVWRGVRFKINAEAPSCVYLMLCSQLFWFSPLALRPWSPLQTQSTPPSKTTDSCEFRKMHQEGSGWHSERPTQVNVSIRMLLLR
ncbi:hypothetical protein C6341_g13591 [Phytophthora cactorum]|nr:hypothetical protein C6341_g13591 [Phytophthora cactorum]